MAARPVRDEWLEKSAAVAAKKNVAATPIVFEGNAPANIGDNPILRSLLAADSLQATNSPRIWLGAPNSIKGPTEAVFRRQGGSHLLIVGQREEAALGMLGVGLISLAAQLPKAGARFLVFDCSAPDSAEAKFLERIVAIIRTKRNSSAPVKLMKRWPRSPPNNRRGSNSPATPDRRRFCSFTACSGTKVEVRRGDELLA